MWKWRPVIVVIVVLAALVAFWGVWPRDPVPEATSIRATDEQVERPGEPESEVE